MKFSNTVRVGTSRYLTKITTLRRKADREQLWVFTAKHTASLQLLCTVGGGQARLDARSEFKISQRSPKGGGEAGRVNECIARPPPLANCRFAIVRGYFWRNCDRPSSAVSWSLWNIVRFPPVTILPNFIGNWRDSIVFAFWRPQRRHS